MIFDSIEVATDRRIIEDEMQELEDQLYKSGMSDSQREIRADGAYRAKMRDFRRKHHKLW